MPCDLGEKERIFSQIQLINPSTYYDGLFPCSFSLACRANADTCAAAPLAKVVRSYVPSSSLQHPYPPSRTLTHGHCGPVVSSIFLVTHLKSSSVRSRPPTSSWALPSSPTAPSKPAEMRSRSGLKSASFGSNTFVTASRKPKRPFAASFGPLPLNRDDRRTHKGSNGMLSTDEVLGSGFAPFPPIPQHRYDEGRTGQIGQQLPLRMLPPFFLGVLLSSFFLQFTGSLLLHDFPSPSTTAVFG